MKQAKGPCCATAAVESGYAGDWRGFAASSRSAYAHASALAHSRGHVSEGAAGTGAGSGEHELREQKIECEKGRVWEAVNCEKYVGRVLPMILQDDE
jgi:hypothetical protein